MNIRSTLAIKKATNYAVKASGISIADVDMSKRVVTGFYNAYNFYDGGNDVFLDGCFAKSIAENGPTSTATAKIKHLVDHNWSKLPGKITTLEETTKDAVSGLYFETKMVGTQLGTDTLINYQEGVYDNHSVGFRYVNGVLVTADDAAWNKYLGVLSNPKDAEKEGFMFVWTENMLWEGSTVAFGENSLTPYLGVKSLDKLALSLKINDRITLLQKQLSSGTQSDDTMSTFEMELLQIKQYISEIFTTEPSAKDTLLLGRKDANTHTERKSDLLTFTTKN